MSEAELAGWVATLLLLPLLAISLYNLATAPRLERVGAPVKWPRVALLVPARNEAENLARVLPALIATDYPRLEILVLDDCSEDGSAAIVGSCAAASHGRLRLLPGTPLPPDWLGKNWACHQLAEATDADLLIFCDADVTPAPGAVLETVAWMQRTRADALTALPRQRFGSWAEAAVVPLIVQLPVLALLPMRLALRRPEPALSMGNGQWLAMTRAAYERAGGHASVRASVVEDMALARRAKEAGLRLLPVVAARSLEIRMYADAASVRAGLRKTLNPLLGGGPAAFSMTLVLGILLGVLPWALFLADPRAGAAPLALVVGIRLCGASLFRHDWRCLALHPVGALCALALLVDSFLAHRFGTARWKGRPVVTMATP